MSTLFYRPQTLETIARKTLSEYDAFYLNSAPAPVPIETIIEKVFGLRIEYQDKSIGWSYGRNQKEPFVGKAKAARIDGKTVGDVCRLYGVLS